METQRYDLMREVFEDFKTNMDLTEIELLKDTDDKYPMFFDNISPPKKNKKRRRPRGHY